MTFAFHYIPDAFTLEGRIMGRQSAGASFLKAIAGANLPHVFTFTRSEDNARSLAKELAALGAASTRVGFLSDSNPRGLARPGLLYRPDPGIGQDAWRRHAAGGTRDWSICGITHTISTHAAMDAIANLITAPLEPWDALITTSRAGLYAVKSVLEAQAEHLRERVGATRFTLPQLPVIPLGVHTEDFTFTSEQRGAARARFGLAEEEVAVLFAGRLVPHGKAHPLPMYRALDQAAQGRRVVLIQAGIAPNEHMERMFAEEPSQLCPSVRLIKADGRDSDAYRQAWAAADIFTSLSDNIQETFGLTPVEAMAAGLPAVVSDWNGYKDSVRDGIDGFRVPTLTLAPGMGIDLADAYDANIHNFDYYSGYTSQLVAVDVTAAAISYRRLIDSPGLRRRMGEAGRARAREVFSWKVIFRSYQDLWANLADARRGLPSLYPLLSHCRPPHRPDPFAMFAAYPTHAILPETKFQLLPKTSAAVAKAFQELRSVRFAQAVLPPAKLLDALLANWPEGEWRSLDDLTQALPEFPSRALAPTLVWLTKLGLLRYQAPTPSSLPAS